jgi:hypothetical protein
VGYFFIEAEVVRKQDNVFFAKLLPLKERQEGWPADLGGRVRELDLSSLFLTIMGEVCYVFVLYIRGRKVTKTNRIGQFL